MFKSQWGRRIARAERGPSGHAGRRVELDRSVGSVGSDADFGELSRAAAGLHSFLSGRISISSTKCQIYVANVRLKA